MPIDIAVQGWGDDAFAIIAVDGQVDADTCEVLTRAINQARQTYRAAIIDLTLVRRLSAAGLHCLDCGGHTEDERQVYLVCPESSAARMALRTQPIRHRWPVHSDLKSAVQQMMLQQPSIPHMG